MSAPVSEPPDGLELYVYYKLPAAQAIAARQALQQCSEGQSEVQLQLRQRMDRPGELLTWMEIYRGSTAAMLRLESQVAAALRPFIQGERHVERFGPLS